MKQVALWCSVNALGYKPEVDCAHLGELQPGTVLLLTAGTASAMRSFRLEERDAVVWDGEACVHLATNTRLLVDKGIFVFRDPETEAWTL